MFLQGKWGAVIEKKKKVRVARWAGVTNAFAMYVCMLKICMNMEIYTFSYLIISCS